MHLPITSRGVRHKYLLICIDVINIGATGGLIAEITIRKSAFKLQRKYTTISYRLLALTETASRFKSLIRAAPVNPSVLG